MSMLSRSYCVLMTIVALINAFLLLAISAFPFWSDDVLLPMDVSLTISVASPVGGLPVPNVASLVASWYSLLPPEYLTTTWFLTVSPSFGAEILSTFRPTVNVCVAVDGFGWK